MTEVARTNEISLMLAGTAAGTQNSPESEIRALEYLQSIYRDPMEATPARMRAAMAALEYEEPRLSAVAIGHMSGQSFAQALERCLARSAQVAQSPPKTLPAPVVGQTDTQLDHSKPFVLRRRNLR